MVRQVFLMGLVLVSQATPVWADSVSDFQGVFTQYGLPGVIILFMGWGSYKAITTLFQRYDEVQEKRIAAGEATRDALNANTAALNALTEQIKSQKGA